MLKRTLLAAAALLALGAAARADVAIKIGVLNDRSGPYLDISGEASVVAAKMAVDDFGAAAKGITVDIVSADHQNKPDTGANIARQWFDQDGVDVIVDVPNSGVALAVAKVTREKNKIFMDSGAGTSVLTGEQCSPNTVHWTYDTYALAKSTATSIIKQGGKSWYFITADYAFGHALQSDATKFITAEGGTVAGSVNAPFPTSDFSSFLLQAQGSGAQVIGLANAGSDTDNSIKQAAEFGIVAGGQKLAGLLVFISDVNAVGLPVAQGLNLTDGVLLGPGRRHPRLHQALPGAQRRQGADDGPGRRLCQRAPLPQGRRRPEGQGYGGPDGQDARDPDRRPAVRQGQPAHRWARDPRHVPLPGEEPGRVEISERRL